MTNNDLPSYTATLRLEDFKSESYSVLKSYLCPLCKGVLDDPVLERCGEEFYCLHCLEIYMSFNKGCPKGNACLNNNYIKMAFINNIITKHEIFCKNKASGCTWEGIGSELKNHLKETCSHQPVKCPNKGCPKELNQNNIELHLVQCGYREEKCGHCENACTFNEMQNHLAVCPKIKIKCPLNCEEEVERQVVDNHIMKFCVNFSIDCLYKVIGCDFHAERKLMTEHLKNDTDKHNLLMFEKIVGFTGKLNDMSERLNNLEDVVDDNMNVIEKFMNSKKDHHQGSGRKQNSKIRESVDKVIEENKSEKVLSPADFKMINKKRNRDNTNNLNNESNEVNLTSSNKKVVEVVDVNDEQEQQEEELNKALNDFPLAFNSDTQNHCYNFSHKNTPYDEEITFDTLDISKGITVNVNSAFCNSSLPKIDHRFAMVNNVLNDYNSEWKVTINKVVGKWLAVGVCLKELVVSNKFRFMAKKQNFMHGTFMISTNGYFWNSNNDEQNDKPIQNFPTIKAGDEIGFKFWHEEKELEITIGTFNILLRDVRYPKGNYLVPCVVFLNPGDEVTFSKLVRINDS